MPTVTYCSADATRARAGSFSWQWRRVRPRIMGKRFQMPLLKRAKRPTNCLRQMGRKKVMWKKAVLLMQQVQCPEPHASLKQQCRYDYRIYMYKCVRGRPDPGNTRNPDINRIQYTCTRFVLLERLEKNEKTTYKDRGPYCVSRHQSKAMLHTRWNGSIQDCSTPALCKRKTLSPHHLDIFSNLISQSCSGGGWLADNVGSHCFLSHL